MDDNNGYGAVELVITYMVGTIVFITLAVFFVTHPSWFNVFAFFVLFSCVLIMGEFVIRRITRFHYRDIGQFGTLARPIIGRAKTFEPLSIAAPKAEQKVKVTLEVPTVAELLKENMLGTDALLLGYTMEGKPHYGNWNDIRTFAIAGQGRSGKTITMFFIIIQALLNDCTVWIADPHAGKKSSITALLQPLSHWIRFARTDTEIAELTADYIDLMEKRVCGESDDRTPQLFVTDEFTRMVESNEQVYQAVISCAQQYAGFGGYAMIAGHEWTGNGGKLVKLRRAIHAKFVHRLDVGYAKYLLNNNKYARGAEKLHTGFNYFQDSEGTIHELKTPLGKVEDAIAIAARFMPGPDYRQPIESPDYYMKRFVSPGEIQAETKRFEEILSLAAPTETKRFDRKEEVRRLRGLHCNQSHIIQQIWKCKPGESQVYKDALAEYKRILDELRDGPK